MKNVKFNLSKILTYINDEIEEQVRVELLIDDSSIAFRMGGVIYFCDHKKFLEVLEVNEFQYDNSDVEDSDVELLSKHIINQLSASSGIKCYPEVKTLLSDLNQN
ncbi:hypothetical protein [uncultured Chryseobacterium sp.]|uniref:hypothetical protein n=1 Tax=uncultured Chryseobacterium sp. TaxID=259322 RepID=UPI0025FC7DA3|nr:hypothetical protein [uncultured Chryseobacterium sp.]